MDQVILNSHKRFDNYPAYVHPYNSNHTGALQVNFE